jgi:hypothetical protein
MPCHLNGVLLAINFVMRNQFDELYSRPIHLMTELQCLPLAALTPAAGSGANFKSG